MISQEFDSIDPLKEINQIMFCHDITG